MKIMDSVLENCLIPVNGKLKKSAISIKNGKIFSFEKENFSKTIDCNGNVLLPGLIDVHVHFRVPGGEQKEDWVTGSKAAAHGGITTVFDMPNTNPPTVSREALEAKKTIALKDSIIRPRFHFGATKNNLEEAIQLNGINSIKIYMGSSTGDLLLDEELYWIKWFELAKQNDWVIVVHAEHEQSMKSNAQKFSQNNVSIHNKIRSEEVEAIAIEKALKLQQKIGNKLHIAHLSSKAGLELVKEAKQNSQNVSCEAAPHHLFLDESYLEKLGNFGKMNPPLRTKQDVKALWKGVNNGVVDCIATDHAPHTIQEKQQPYFLAPSGVPGVETMLPLLLDEVNKENIELNKIVELCSYNPSKIFSLHDAGSIQIGNFADFALIDLNASQTISAQQNFSKCGWTPFEGRKVQGKVEKTIVNGVIVYGA